MVRIREGTVPPKTNRGYFERKKSEEAHNGCCEPAGSMFFGLGHMMLFLERCSIVLMPLTLWDGPYNPVGKM